jgi:hypothetical protein
MKQFNQSGSFLKAAIACGTAFTWLVNTCSVPAMAVEVKPSDVPQNVAVPSIFSNDAGTNRDFLGTPVNTVPQPVATYQFKANTNYIFYLESTYNGRPAGTVYSTRRFNPGNEQQVTFTGNPAGLCTGGLILAWDDTGSELVPSRSQHDRDFDDFIVQLQDAACKDAPPVGVVPPEPGSPLTPGDAPPTFGGGGGGGGFLAGLAALAGIGAGVALLSSDDDDSDNPSTEASPVLVSGTPGETSPPSPTEPEPEPTPEPLTILGSGFAIGFATLLQRKSARKRQKK